VVNASADAQCRRLVTGWTRATPRRGRVRMEPCEAVLVSQLFDWYLEPQTAVYQLATRLTSLRGAGR
jgi:hypothetical protein